MPLTPVTLGHPAAPSGRPQATAEPPALPDPALRVAPAAPATRITLSRDALLRRPAAVDRDRRSGDVVGRGRAEPQRQRRDLGRV